jgi:phosphate transport system permease protein
MTSSPRSRSSRPSRDRALVWTLSALAAGAGAVLLLVIGFLVFESVDVLRAVGPTRLLGDRSWHPTEGQYGMGPMVLGSLYAMGGAVLLATPLGVLSAVFCLHYAPPRLAGPYRRLVELLAGVPSVVYGFWGLVVLVPLIGRLSPPGASLLAGVLILTLMIIPTIALLSHAALAAVPREQLHGAAALGLSRAAVIARVALPSARAGVLTAVLLAAGRAIGETMAVLMVAGNVVQVPKSVFDPVRTLTANIALEMAYAMGEHRSALFASGLILAVIVAGLVAVVARVERSGAVA